MPDTPSNKRSLSELGHLFLSDVRDRAQPPGATGRPQRIGPKARVQASIDVTPEEMAQVLGNPDHAPISRRETSNCKVSAVIASHLNGHQFERVIQYAKSVAGTGKRVALLEVDTHELRLICFDRDATPPEADEAQSVETFDARDVQQTIEELSWDVERFLVVIPNPRTSEARALLRQFDHWILLSTCDHDGVVSSYRTLKGLSEIHRPRLSLAILDAPSESQAEKVFHKIAGVCHQFLSMPMDSDGLVSSSVDVVDHTAFWWRTTDPSPQNAHWQIIGDFVSLHARPISDETAAAGNMHPASEYPDFSAMLGVTHTDELSSEHEEPKAASMNDPHVFASRHDAHPHNTPIDSHPIPMPVGPAATVAQGSRAHSVASESVTDDVMDLPENLTGPAGILSAVLKHTGGEYVQCPLQVPPCSDAVLTVARDRRLVLHAVARQGLTDLRAIAKAFRWMNENRALIAMALPQFAVDVHSTPTLRVLVDHSDISADILQPLLESRNVKVQSYRKLKWGGKTGLLLEAA